MEIIIKPLKESLIKPFIFDFSCGPLSKVKLYVHDLDKKNNDNKPGPILQSIVSPTADPVVTSSITALSNTFVEIGHEIISSVLLLLLIQEGLLSVTSESMSTK